MSAKRSFESPTGGPGFGVSGLLEPAMREPWVGWIRSEMGAAEVWPSRLVGGVKNTRAFYAPTRPYFGVLVSAASPAKGLANPRATRRLRNVPYASNRRDEPH